MGDEESVTLPKALLEKYYSEYFVETGSFYGGAIQLAIECGFSDIRSIEVDPDLYAHCCDRFRHDLRVGLFLGDSARELPFVIEDIDDRITFWLDAHAGNSPTVGETLAPLLKELDIIARHPRRDHIIMIDDVRLFGKNYWGLVTEKAVLGGLRDINPDYKIVYENSKLYPDDILVAYVSEE